MLPNLQEIKKKRKILGLTQAELGKLSGISQSLITKIESGSVIPSYDKAKKIFDLLDSIKAKAELKAKNVMTKKLSFVREGDKIKKAIKLMDENALSQLPVLKKTNIVGTISEQGVLYSINKNNITSESKVNEIMEEPMPIINIETPLTAVLGLLEYNSGVLCTNKGKIKGIITKSNLLKTMTKNQI